VCAAKLTDTVNKLTKRFTPGLQRAKKKTIFPLGSGAAAFFNLTSSIEEYPEMKEDKN